MNLSDDREDPAWGKDGVIEITGPMSAQLDPLIAAAMFDIADATVADHPDAVTRLNDLAARFPGWWRAQYERPTAKASRRVLEAIVSTASQLAGSPSRMAQRRLEAMLWTADSEAGWSLARELVQDTQDLDERDRIAGFPTACADQPVRLAAAAKRAAARMTDRSGPAVDRELRAAVGELVALYELLSGRKATHSRSDRNGYNGVVNTAAGQFCALFLNAVEPRATPRLAAAMTSHLHKRKRRIPRAGA